jgi:predicted nucleic acid-binding protein
MRKTIISDTSCFILLSNIGELELLHKVYGTIVTTLDISIEFGEPIPEWVEIVAVKDTLKQQLLEMQIDKGESSAIALALETPNCTLILDDYKARKIAKHLNLKYTGTIGVIIKAKLIGVIPSIKPLLEKIKKTNFRLAEDVESFALKQANESY